MFTINLNYKTLLKIRCKNDCLNHITNINQILNNLQYNSIKKMLVLVIKNTLFYNNINKTMTNANTEIIK